MLVSEIRSRFKTYADVMSFNYSTTQLNNIFAKAQKYYWDGLAKNWNSTLENSIDIAAIAKRITITPISNLVTYAQISADYDMIGFVRPTYVVGAETHSFPAKVITENMKYSALSNGTTRHPKYYLQDDGLVLEPSTTPTSFFCTFLRKPYVIDFAIPATDIPYTEANVQGIIQVALNNIAVTQREYDQAQQAIVEAQFNTKQP